MTQYDNRPDEVAISDLLRPLIGQSRKIRHATFIAVMVVGLIALLVFLAQPVRQMAALRFRPTFQGAEQGKYPNGLPFGAADIIDAVMLNTIYEENGIQEYCAAEQFKSGFTVLITSKELEFVDMDYQARLSDARLTAVERQRLVEEYQRNRAAVPRRYELQFLKQRDCTKLPDPIAAKLVSDTLEAWARHSIDKRGVTRIRVAVLTPQVIDVALERGDNLLVRADTLRSAVQRIIANIREVERIPGAEIVRGSSRQVSFFEVRVELETLLQSRLSPLVLRAGRFVGEQSKTWIEQALHGATIEAQAAEQRAEAYRVAFREYSGMTAAPSPGSAPPPSRGTSDVQGITPQIDRTFIDRIVEMSQLNTAFRQQLTTELISASVSAVEKKAVMEQYRQLSESMSRSGRTDTASREELAAALQRIAEDAKEATRRFMEIYETFSRVTLHTGSAMYVTEGPVEITRLRTVSALTLLKAIVLVALITPILYAVLLVLRFHARRLMPSRARQEDRTTEIV